jgi:hypothetical protein
VGGAFNQCCVNDAWVELFNDPVSLSFRAALEFTREIIEGFQSPRGLEQLATVHWLIERENCDSSVERIRNGLEIGQAKSGFPKESSVFSMSVL